MQQPLGKSEQGLEWMVFVLMRNTKGYASLQMDWLNENQDITADQREKATEGLYENHPFLSQFTGDQAKGLSITVKDALDKQADAFKSKFAEGQIEGTAEGSGADFLANTKYNYPRFQMHYENLKEIYPDIEDITLGELGFPLLLTSVSECSRNLILDGVSRASFTLVDALNVSPRDTSFLTDMVKKVARYQRPPYTPELLDSLKDQRLRPLYDSYFGMGDNADILSGDELDWVENIQNQEVLDSVTEPVYSEVAAGKFKELTCFLRNVMHIHSVRDPGGQGFPLTFKDRLKLALSAKMGNSDASKLLYSDYLYHRYALSFEDMSPVWIFVKRPPLYPKDTPRWTFYFHGFISDFKFARNATSNTFDVEVGCLCPLGYLATAQIRTQYSIMYWMSELANSSSEQPYLYELMQRTFEASGSIAKVYFENYFQQKTLAQVIDQIITFTQGTNTFLGVAAFLRLFGYPDTTSIGASNPKNSNLPSEVSIKTGNIANALSSGYLSHKDFFRFDYIWMPNSETKEGQTSLLPFCSLANQGTNEENESYKMIVKDENYVRENWDKFSTAGEGANSDDSNAMINSPWLWSYRGYDLNQIYNPDDFKTKKDSLGEDLGWLRKQGNPVQLVLAWWFGMPGRNYSLREKWLPRIKLDTTLYSGSILQALFANNFDFGATEQTTAPISIFQQMSTVIRGHFFSDAQGNLCFVSRRMDDLPAIRKQADWSILYGGYCPYISIYSLRKALGLTEETLGGISDYWGRLTTGYISERIKEINPILFKDHDNRYIVTGDFYKSFKYNFDQTKKLTMVSIKGNLHYLTFGSVMDLFYLTGYSGSQLYDQSKYGYRYANLEKLATLPLQGNIESTDEYKRELIQSAAAASLRDRNAQVTQGSIDLKYQTLWLQLGRNMYLPDFQYKGFIRGIADTISKDNMTGTVTFDFLVDVATIIGNPYLEFAIKYGSDAVSYINHKTKEERESKIIGNTVDDWVANSSSRDVNNTSVIIIHSSWDGVNTLEDYFKVPPPRRNPSGYFHFFIETDGTVRVTLPLDRNAQSTYSNVGGINAKSVVIEMAGSSFTEEQYNSLAGVLASGCGVTEEEIKNKSGRCLIEPNTIGPTKNKLTPPDSKSMNAANWAVMSETDITSYKSELSNYYGWIGHNAVDHEKIGGKYTADPINLDWSKLIQKYTEKRLGEINLNITPIIGGF